MYGNSLISIIIPVYNVEKYLAKCLTSILDSTYKNIELIIVENGSTDNSWTICDSFRKKYKNVTAIRTEIKGLSHARNLGLSMAKGEYIAYVDSDDYVSPYMYETLIAVAKRYNADMVVSNYIKGDNYNYQFKKNINFDLCKMIDKNEYSYFSYIKNLPLYNVAWNKLYKKDVVYDIRFNETLKYCEDRSYIGECLFKINEIVYIDEALYYYNLGNTNSICRTNFNFKDRMDQIYSLIYDREKYKRDDLVYEYINLCLLKTCDFRLKRSIEEHLDNTKEIQIILKDALTEVFKAKKVNKIIKYRFLLEHYLPFVERLEGALIKLRNKFI